MVKVGEVIPEFKVKALHKNQIIDINSVDLDGEWFILFFYPADFTFVCPTELIELNELRAEFEKIGVKIFSVSNDTVWVHQAWRNESEKIRDIEFPMIGDPTTNLSKDFNVYVEGVGVSLRASFLINPKKELVLSEINSDGVGRNSQEFLRKTLAAKKVEKEGVACPASWNPNKSVLKPSLDLVGKI